MGSLSFVMYFWQTFYNTKIILYVIFFEKVVKWCRFNSVQFLLLRWDKKSNKIEKNRTVLQYQYPYYLMNEKETKAVLPICTDELNYHRFDHIHVRWDGLFEVGLMRKYANGGNYEYKELYERAWKEEEKKIKDEHPR